MPTLPVTPALLRHFAVFTVAATACLSMFASGENSAAKQQKVQPQGQSQAGIWGAEEAALRGARAEKPREVGGLRLAKGTELNRRDDEYEPRRDEPAALGDIRYLDPSIGSPRPIEIDAALPGQPGAPAAATPAVVRDPAGVPLIGAGLRRPGQRPGQPPRPPSQADYDRMIAATTKRSGMPTTDPAEATPD